MIRFVSLFACLILWPQLVLGQSPADDGVQSLRAAVTDVLSQLNRNLAEFDALHERRVQLEKWIDEERGVRESDHHGVQSRARELRYVREAVVEASEALSTTENVDELSELLRYLARQMAELQTSIDSERMAVEALTTHFETLRNEDVPPIR